MTQYKPNIPQPSDLISVSQDDLLKNFQYLNTFLDVEHQQSGLDTTATGSGRHRTVSMPNSGTLTIASITPSVSPTTITTAAPLPASFATGDSVYIKEATGTVQTVIENKSFIATKTGASTFTIAVNTSGKTYTGGGYIGINPAIPSGTTEILYTNNGNLFSRNSLRVMNITGGAGSLGPEGYINLASNFILQYGIVNKDGAASGTVTFPIEFPSNVFSITIGIIRNDSSTDQFVYINSALPIDKTKFSYTRSTNTSAFYWMAIGI